MNKKNLLIASIGIIAIVAISFGTWLILKGDKNISYQDIKVKRGSIAKEIKASGPIKTAENADLSWEKAGRIASVNVHVGDQVKAGQIIMSQDGADLNSQLAQANANLAASQAVLLQLTNGARPEEISQKQIALDQANDNLAAGYASALVALADAQAKTGDAIQTYTNALFVNPNNNLIKLSFLTADSRLEADLLAQREKINKEISDWVNDLPKLNQNDTAGIDSELSLAEKNLGDIRQYLSACFATINASVNLTPAQISAYQNSLGASGVSGARSEIDSASAAITNQKQALDNSKSLIAQSQNALALTQAGARTEDIAAQTARVAQAQAAVYAAQAAAAKNTLRSPIDGQIAKISGSVGEFASPGIPVATVINSRQYEIEIRLSETDVAQVSLGDEAQVTLDAYPGQAYSAKVVAIDGAPSIDENHSTGYKVKLNLTENNSAIKTDMTANVNISVARKSSALILPQTAVIRVNDQYFVMRPGNIRQEVKIGLWGSDGQAEVISGLNEGDSVIILGQ